MIKHECDRCGIIVEPKTGIERITNNFCTAFSELISTLTGQHIYTVYDATAREKAVLCDECQASFKEWLKQGNLLIEQGAAKHEQ